MLDLESGLHYLLRVELATHKTLEGDELKTFKDFVTVTAKVGRTSRERESVRECVCVCLCMCE